jgi:recombination protein RecT
MSIKAEANGQLARREERPKSIQSVLSSPSMTLALKMALPKHITPERIARVALTALTKNPKLAECTQESFFGSLLSAAQLGLEVNTPLGQAYLIPYGRDCQLVIGYQGMIDISGRSGTRVRGNVVREGDFFEVEYGLQQKLVHKPSTDGDREERPITHVYAIAKIPPSNDEVFTVLSRAEVEKYRKRSKSSNSGPWVTDWEPMAVKTAVRRLFRWLPKSVELQQAIVLDESHERDGQRESYDQTVVDALGSLQLAEHNEQTESSAAQ